MKKFFLFTLLCFALQQLCAAPVDLVQAQKVGVRFLNTVKQVSTTRESVEIVYPSVAERGNMQAAYYIFNVGNNFVIVAGDDIIKPILGYSTSGKFYLEGMPENIQGFLQSVESEIHYALEHHIQPEEATIRQWTALNSGTSNRSAFTRNTRNINPLLTTTWNQGTYYNDLCPTDIAGQNNHTWAGCVACALSQIINYWEYPVSGTGTHRYTDENYGEQSVNFQNTVYQYNLMPDELTSSSSAAQINAVATLMYHCGVACNMEYNTDGSSAYGIVARSALINHFNYQAAVQYADRNQYDLDTWKQLLKADLDLGHPVYYGGTGSAGGHAFVCDGYDNADLFHFNWGWSGYNDGYFAIDVLNPGTYTFNTRQYAIFNIMPAAAETLNIPAAPSNFTATPSDNGQVSATLSWTNPSLTINGTALSSLTSIVIQRNGTTIHTLSNPAVGATQSWTDNTMTELNNYTYSIYATNEAGEGVTTNYTMMCSYCPITVVMRNTGEIGWHIGYVDFTYNGISQGTAVLNNAAVDTIQIDLPRGFVINCNWVATDPIFTFNDACSFTLSNSDGTVFYNSSVNPTPGTLCSFTPTCTTNVNTQPTTTPAANRQRSTNPDDPNEQLFVFNIDGTTSQTISSAAIIGHPLGFNTLLTTNYSNSFNNQLVLYPADTNSQLLFEVVEYNQQNLQVYDGVGTTGAQLLGSINAQTQPVMSFAGALTLVYSGNWYANGFTVRVSTVSCQPMVYGLSCTQTGGNYATLNWNVFGHNAWQNHDFNYTIEYGLQGFSPGTGTIVTTTDAMTTLFGLAPETGYAAYLTYTCSNSETNTIGPVLFNTTVMTECSAPIGEGTETTNDFPIGTDFNYSYSQQIYTVEELTAAGLSAGELIGSVAFQYVSQNELNRDSIKIFMANTAQAAFTTSNWIPFANFQPVFSGNISMSNSSDYWNTIYFDSTFTWNGTDNIVIAVLNNSGIWQSNRNFYTHTTTDYRTLYSQNDNSPILPETLTSGDRVNRSNNIRFCVTTDCYKPNHVTYSEINRSTIQLDWQPGFDETSWNIEYGPIGFTHGTGTLLSSDTNSMIIGQLVSGIYDFYIQSDCGDATSSWTKAHVSVNHNCAEIGEGTISNSIFPIGYYSSNYYTYTQQLYTANELSIGLSDNATIQSLSFQYGGTTQTKSPVSVYLCNTTQTTLTDWIPASELTQVYSGSVTLENGWVTIQFDNPFVWDGHSIVVAMLNSSGTENRSSLSYMHSTGNNMALERTTSYPVDMDNPGDISRYSQRNNIQFCTESQPFYTLTRTIDITLIDGSQYDFYGTMISEQGRYEHRWVVSEECDSLVVLNVTIKKIIYVTTTGAGVRDGSSWANAMQLQTALDTCGSYTDFTPYIYVKKGTYSGSTTGSNSFEIQPNARVYGGFAGTETPDFDLSNRDLTTNQTILFGSNVRRVLYQSEDFTDSQATLFDGFTIRGGTVNNDISSGGAAYIRKNCTLNNCVITANNAAVSGSASDIRRYGIAVYNEGGVIQNCNIYGNSINLSGTGSNYSIYGVGLYNKGGLVTGCTLNNNTAVYDGTGNNWKTYGGGIYNTGNGTARNCTITGNSASHGGGIFTNTTIEYCIIANNTVRTYGGGIYISGNGTNINHCHIGNNTSGDEGGGLFSSYHINLTNCNIVRNSAVNNGGGLHVNGNALISNTIIWGNKVGVNDNQFNNSTSYTLYSCAVQGGYTGAIRLFDDNVGTGIGYPKFTNPTTVAGVDVNNAVGDWTLMEGSACINLGNNYYATEEFDLAGNTRIQQGRIDVGAYESSFNIAYPVVPEEPSHIIYVTPAGAGLQNGSSWSNALSDLQYAMDVAAGFDKVPAIWVAQGTYLPTNTYIVQPKVAVYGGFAGTEPYTCDISLRNFETHPSILDGQNTKKVLKQSCPIADNNVATPEDTSSLSLTFTAGKNLFDGFTIQNGQADSYGGATLVGGVDLLNCTFTGNTNGALNITNGKATNCTFRQNTGTGVQASNATLTNCVSHNNTDKGFDLGEGSKMILCNSYANGGTGIYSSNSQITNCTSNNNTFGGVRASGGVYVNVNIANNTSNDNGAGVYAENGVKFVNCNIVNNKSNSSEHVGGIYNADSWSGNGEFTNCIIWGNKSGNAVSNLDNVRGTYSYCAIEGGYQGVANISVAGSNSGSQTDSSYVHFVNPTTTSGITIQTTYDWNLAAGSACINAGNPNTTSLNLPLYDLGGSLRIKQQLLDIGAYEYGGITYQTINDSICLGESFFYGDYFVYPETPGLFRDTFIYYQSGVDYIAYINLMVNDIYHTIVEATICEGQTYAFNGTNLTTTGVYEANLQSVCGCDSTVVLQLTVNPTAYYEWNTTACDSFTWNEQTYYVSGNYQQTFASATGCDSIATLHLIINESNSSEFTKTACVSYTWNGQTYNQSGDYTQMLTNAAHCDSVVTMHLTIIEVITTTFSDTACDSYTWNEQTYTQSGDYLQTFSAVSTCDSLVTLHLTIYPSVENTIQATECDSFAWNNITYYESGNYTQSFETTHGCDSVVTMDLTIRNSSIYEFSATECDSFIWNSITYTESGDYVQTLPNAVSCDSTITLHLTINPTVLNSFNATTCYSYSWNDSIYYNSGDYVQTFTAQTGCDSIVTLHLTVIGDFVPEITVSGTVTACGSGTAILSVTNPYAGYVWSSGSTTPTISVTDAGYYWVVVTDTNGCHGTSAMTHLGATELISGTPSICMVGVENNHNLIIWEEMDDPDVQNYKIYRENDQADIYEPLAIVSANNPNVYEDTASNPNVRAYRYKIAAMDVCQGETPLSNYHKTVHLTINQGIGNSWNLIWSPYEGFEFASYKLYRGTTNHNLELIETMPSTLNSYTDFDNVQGALFYQIEVVMNSSCVRQTRDITYTGSRSNIVYNGETVTSQITVSACSSYIWNDSTYTTSGDYVQYFHSVLGYDSVVTLHLTVYDYPEIDIIGDTIITNGEPTTLIATTTSSDAMNWLWSTGETTREITVLPATTAQYSVVGTNAGGCADTAHITIHNHTGIISREITPEDIRLYPNPASRAVMVELSDPSCFIEKMIVYDVVGKEIEVIESSCTRSNEMIDLQKYVSGTYYISIYSNRGLTVKKLVISKSCY